MIKMGWRAEDKRQFAATLSMVLPALLIGNVLVFVTGYWGLLSVGLLIAGIYFAYVQMQSRMVAQELSRSPPERELEVWINGVNAGSIPAAVFFGICRSVIENPGTHLANYHRLIIAVFRTLRRAAILVPILAGIVGLWILATPENLESVIRAINESQDPVRLVAETVRRSTLILLILAVVLVVLTSCMAEVRNPGTKLINFPVMDRIPARVNQRVRSWLTAPADGEIEVLDPARLTKNLFRGECELEPAGNA